MATTIEVLRARMAKAVKLERVAMTRLRRALTLYDKAYERTQRAIDRIAEVEANAAKMTERLGED